MIATRGEAQLRWLLPGVQTAEKKLRAHAASQGIEYIIAEFGGARTESVVSMLLRWRDEAVARGEPFYRVSPYKSTYHSRGAAFDIRITKRPAGMSLDDAYRVLGEYAPKIGLVWGGNFSQPADIYHFQSQQTLAQVEARWLNWINDPAYPSGFADPWVLGALVLVGIILLIILRR